MKRLQLYGALPRVRSSSISSLAVSTPSSSSRPILSAPPRIPSEAPKQSQHSQLALTQPNSGLHPTLLPCTPPITPTFNPMPPQATSSLSAHVTEAPRAAKRQRLQYQLDVGAYGIPKHRSNHPHSRTFHTRSHTPSSSTYPHTSLSVQVGEDAYFVRDNAMGIADGVGGWARTHPQSSQHPTPSALFSRRLMHFCSAEIEALSTSDPAIFTSAPDPASPRSRPPTTQFSFQHHLKPRPAPPPSHDAYTFSELEDSLHSSLEELSEGIDVLQILERAYDSTVKAHLAPSAPTPVPLTTGSSTALLAVLDHPPPPTLHPHPLLQSPEPPHKNYAAGSIHVSPIEAQPTPQPSAALSQPQAPNSSSAIPPDSEPAPSISRKSDAACAPDAEADPNSYDAVIRIAHLGDCMGMLVRDDRIVWRSDEMWWGYNHPLQLGPPSTPLTDPTEPLQLPVKPHTFTLPVCADDILILASDGLSDNLWDEDVLDEVLKFRKQDGWGFSSSGSSLFSSSGSLSNAFASLNIDPRSEKLSHDTHILRRKAFAGMLSEALCSRAKRVSEMRPPPRRRPSLSSSSSPTSSSSLKFSVIPEEPQPSSNAKPSVSLVTSDDDSSSPSSESSPSSGSTLRSSANEDPADPAEIPFARRARLAGRSFRGGKHDDISVIVAVVSPLPSVPSAPAAGSIATPAGPANGHAKEARSAL
ncbi:unnamed protein product [Cyclocybe aegerita]|uniref:Protein phosphatase n=1 Tax=Cyclocybe aegerita TaxID=1973307 RepID=A0A8S0VTZ5_CYCAE|nr:unnamed protein product [Cyclocybe aegerita]